MTLPPTGKLVRDLIPEIIRKTGKRPETCVVSGDDHTEALRQKLGEEEGWRMTTLVVGTQTPAPTRHGRMSTVASLNTWMDGPF